MKLAMMLPAKPDIKWEYARQLGVVNAITKAAPELTGLPDPSDYDALKTVRDRFTEAGFKLQGLEGDEFDMNRIKMGLPGRDEDIEKYQAMLRNMGRLGINLLCYNFMAGVGWFRSRVDIPERGGALTSGFYQEDVSGQEYELKITPEQLWDNYKYFIDAVLPVAEESGVKMALHPDDPPVSPLCGYSRILISADAFRTAMSLSDSAYHGITFCFATFKAMGEDVLKLLPEFKKKIFFTHFRDITGSKVAFRETFHDNGPTEMGRLLEGCKQNGIDVLVRPDHCPTMAGEDNSNPGYAVLGKVFAIGYMKGLLEVQGIPFN